MEAERAVGVTHLSSRTALRVSAQVMALDRLDPAGLDPRLGPLDADKLAASEAVIVNIEYPLGLAAYNILRELTEGTDTLRGAYVLGKAATLNADVGDVLISGVIHDEHSGSTYWLDNAFSFDDIAPYLVFGSGLDNQRAVTVKSTFLQNRNYLDFYYREAYTVVEMEAGPFCNAVYEVADADRYPVGEAVSFAKLPIDFGIIHYASDTPYTQARTLGASGLSYFGMDSTYASSVAILRRILKLEGVLDGPVSGRAVLRHGRLARDRPGRGRARVRRARGDRVAVVHYGASRESERRGRLAAERCRLRPGAARAGGRRSRRPWARTAVRANGRRRGRRSTAPAPGRSDVTRRNNAGVDRSNRRRSVGDEAWQRTGPASTTWNNGRVEPECPTERTGWERHAWATPEDAARRRSRRAGPATTSCTGWWPARAAAARRGSNVASRMARGRAVAPTYAAWRAAPPRSAPGGRRNAACDLRRSDAGLRRDLGRGEVVRRRRAPSPGSRAGHGIAVTSVAPGFTAIRTAEVAGRRRGP